ncbi:MAG: ISAs1 family transposase, partial [Gemmataceae bacterium]
HPQWKGIKSIGMTITYSGETCDGEVRYYILSFANDVNKFANCVRSHWGIENSLHWVMDVTFSEDASRIHKDHGGENCSWLRRLAITLIKNEKTVKDSIRAKRLRAGYDIEYLQKIPNAIPDEN